MFHMLYLSFSGDIEYFLFFSIDIADEPNVVIICACCPSAFKTWSPSEEAGRVHVDCSSTPTCSLWGPDCDNPKMNVINKARLLRYLGI